MHWPNVSMLSMIKPLELPVNRRTRWSYCSSLALCIDRNSILTSCTNKVGGAAMYLWSLLHQCKKRQCNMMCNGNQFAEKMCFLRVRFTGSLKKFWLNKWPNDKSASTCCKRVKSNGGWSSSRLLVYSLLVYLSFVVYWSSSRLLVYLSSVVYWSSSRQQCSLSVWTKKPWPNHQDSSYLTVLVLSCPLCRF